MERHGPSQRLSLPWMGNRFFGQEGIHRRRSMDHIDFAHGMGRPSKVPAYIVGIQPSELPLLFPMSPSTVEALRCTGRGRRA